MRVVVVVQLRLAILHGVMDQLSDLGFKPDQAFDHGLDAALDVFDVRAVLEGDSAVAAVLLAALESEIWADCQLVPVESMEWRLACIPV